MIVFLKIAIVILVITIFGFMYHVDTTYCYENLFPPSENVLIFPRCSPTFGVVNLLVETVNWVSSGFVK